MDIRRIAAWYRRMLRGACCLAFSLLALGAVSVAQGTAMSEPDDTKPVQITGCMTARTRNGGFVLSSVFGRPVTVVGPSFLQVGLGHQVTLTGTWQSNGIAPQKNQLERLFIASSVKVTARQCASPPSPTSTATGSAKHSGS